MEVYIGKTVEEAIEAACQARGVSANELIYRVLDKKVGLFSKKFQIEVYDYSDVIMFAEDYLLNVIDSLGIESTVNSKLDDTGLPPQFHFSNLICPHP